MVAESAEALVQGQRQDGDGPPGPDVAGLFDAARKRWPRPVSLLADNKAGSVYDKYPYLFAPAFPGVGDAALVTLAAAARFYAFALFALDEIIDRDSAAADSVALPLDTFALLHEAYTTLGGLFPPTSPFWPGLQSRLRCYVAAVAAEDAFVSGARDISELTEDEAEGLARGKCAIAEVTACALAALAADGSAGDRVTGSIVGYNIACQLLDDVRDWRKDAEAGRPSLALAQALRIAGLRAADLAGADGPDRAVMLDAVGRALYFGGAAASIIDRADAALRQAAESVRGLPLQPWLGHLDKTRGRAAALRVTLPGPAAGSTAGPRIQPALVFRFPRPGDSPERLLALSTLRWLLQQWRLHFHEARHVMRFGAGLGFTGAELQVGDVFARAIVTGTLIDADDVLGGQLQPCIDREISYLMAARRSEPGLWSYFPGLPELPPDADDAAEVIRLLVRTGRAAELAGQIRDCLSLAFGDCAHGDGSFETWLIPGGAAGPVAVRQREYARRFWGEGPDVEVMANLLQAARLFDRCAHAQPVASGIGYVLAAQDADGSWPTSWYHGRGYAAYACSRLLADHPEAGREQLRSCGQQAEAAVNGSTAAQGGGRAAASAGEPGPVSTALALLALAEVRRGGLPVRDDAVRAGLGRLSRWQDADGGLPTAQFVRMELGRTGELPAHTLSYGSRTVTTALACRAALAWTEWPQ